MEPPHSLILSSLSCYTESLTQEDAIMKIEIRPGEGGQDAELFAHDLARAISAYVNEPAVADGKTHTISCL